MKANDYDTAINELNNSLGVDPKYARPMITLGSVYYLQALKPFDQTKKPSDIDSELLAEAIEKFNQALKAEHQPALSNIPTKAHFGLGQSFLMQSYSGLDTPLNAAVEEFEIVIANYGDGKNPNVRELAAESHARLGLIYDLSGHFSRAAQEYQSAADLLFDNPERQKQYQERSQELLEKITTATP